MKAKLLEHQPPGGDRVRLEERLPLDTPFVIQIFPIYACNFTCKYCHFSIERSQRCFVTDRVSMDLGLYQKCINEIQTFPEKVKTLRFVGMGEPLLHPKIVEMVRYAKEKNVANRIEILSNGSLLTSALSDALVDAGLDRLVISLQGISAEEYWKMSSVHLDFKAFVDGIRYFFEHRRQTHVYLKIVDIALKDEEERQRYFGIFGNICDTIGIEHAVPIFSDVQYNKELATHARETQFGTEVIPSRICPQPFYILQINPDGKVVGCHSVAYPEILGDCNLDSVVNIWNGENYNRFRYRMLHGMDTVCDVCRNCNMMTLRTQPEDAIFDKSDRLKKFYEKNEK